MFNGNKYAQNSWITPQNHRKRLQNQISLKKKTNACDSTCNVIEYTCKYNSQNCLFSNKIYTCTYIKKYPKSRRHIYTLKFSAYYFIYKSACIGSGLCKIFVLIYSESWKKTKWRRNKYWVYFKRKYSDYTWFLKVFSAIRYIELAKHRL